MKKAKRRGVFLIVSGLILIAGAVGLSGYNIMEDRRASSASEEVLKRFEEARSRQMIVADSEHEELAPEEISEEMADPNRAMPAIDIDGYRYIGTVAIPPLELELPVMEEWDHTRMKTAPCRYSGSVYLDDLVICGHNYSSQFARLENLQQNDLVIFTDAEGIVYKYNVSEIEIVAPAAVDDMITGDWDLTLFTCNYSGRARVAVRCIKAN